MGKFIDAHPDCVRSRRGVGIDRIAIHTAEGTAAGTIRWFQMSKAERARATLRREPTAAEIAAVVPTATHYVVDHDGTITQMVDDAYSCLHAGNNAWNRRSIGIEHAGRTHDDVPPTEAQYRGSARAVAALCRTYGIPADRVHIVGHSEIPGATHTDPGPSWDWTRYMALVREELG